MKKRYTDEQIIGPLKQAAEGAPIKELSPQVRRDRCDEDEPLRAPGVRLDGPVAHGVHVCVARNYDMEFDMSELFEQGQFRIPSSSGRTGRGSKDLARSC